MRFLFVQAVAQLIRHDIFLHLHDFAALHSEVLALPILPRQAEAGDIDKICQTVAYACIWYPNQVLCLQRSAVTVALLRRYGIHAEMVIGAQRLPMKSHAWVEVDGQVVNDKPELQADYFILDRC